MQKVNKNYFMFKNITKIAKINKKINIINKIINK